MSAVVPGHNAALWITVLGGRHALISPHAIERYVERVRPVGHRAALREIRALITNHCETSTEQPEWLRDVAPDAAGWWLIAGDVAFRLRVTDHMLSIHTVYVRGSIGPERRARRTARHAAKRARRRGRAGPDKRQVAREGRRARRERRGAW